MEKINWFFNSDFEEKLFADDFSTFHSTKMTQEFEYFISYLNPDATLYSLKHYSKDFLSRFKLYTGKDFLITRVNQNVIPWCQRYDKVELLRKYQNKLTTLKYFSQLGIIQHLVTEISSSSDLEPGYLYKNPYSLSGIGHYEYPRDELKLQKLLNKQILIKEEKLKRVKDISALIENNKILSIYENDVDSHYQYKGSLISDSAILGPKQQDQYLNNIKMVMDYVKDYTGVYSIDSFYYEAEGKNLLQPVSEINMRKTMGYVAFHLKKKYFTKAQFAKLILVPNKKSVKLSLHERIMWLSPTENRFHVFLIAGEERAEILEMQDKLLATLL